MRAIGEPTLNQARWKQMIRRALLKKNRAGLGDFKSPQLKESKREKTREFWRTHPEVQPWNMKNGKTSKHWVEEARDARNRGEV